MPIYRNIDGTSKQSFEIGLKGVKLSTKTTIVDEENQDNIKKLLVDGKAVVTEDSVFIHRSLVSNWQVDEDNGICTFFCKYINDDGTIKTSNIQLKTIDYKEENTGGIVVNGTANNIPVFDETGKALKDSGYRVLSSILNSNEMDDENSIPTVAAVKAYVGKVEEPLDQRTQGYNAKILDK